MPLQRHRPGFTRSLHPAAHAARCPGLAPPAPILRDRELIDRLTRWGWEWEDLALLWVLGDD